MYYRDMDIKRLGEIAKISSGSTPARNNQDFWNGDIPWVSTGELSSGFVNETREHVSLRAVHETSLKLLKPGTLLMAMYGQGKTRGIVSRLNITATTNQACASIEIKKDEPSYVYYFLQFRYESIRKLSNGGSQENLSTEIIKKIKISLPPIAEQRKIAEILSAQDRIIELKTKLLEEKKRLKKYLCQVLLSGKRRFSSFSDKWKQNPLSDFLTESRLRGSNGKTAKKLTVKLWGKGVTEKKETLSGSENTAYFRRTKGQFIYSKLDFLNGAFGIIPDELDGYESTIDLPAFDVHHINTEFLLLCVSDAAFYKRNGAIANGGRKAKRINPNDFLSFCINQPSLSEQTSIVDVFRRVDEVITLCENEIKQEQFKKKALMQQLLTGKIRVKV